MNAHSETLKDDLWRVENFVLDTRWDNTIVNMGRFLWNDFEILKSLKEIVKIFLQFQSVCAVTTAKNEDLLDSKDF